MICSVRRGGSSRVGPYKYKAIKIAVVKEKYKLISEQLAHSNNLKALLLDVITHDLKNPAGVIKTCTEMLADKIDHSEYLELIGSSTDKLFSVMDNAVTLSRLSLGESIENKYFRVGICRMCQLGVSCQDWP